MILTCFMEDNKLNNRGTVSCIQSPFKNVKFVNNTHRNINTVQEFTGEQVFGVTLRPPGYIA